MTGYWRLPELSAEALRDGWLHTGDLGVWDDEGYLYLVDRKKEMIVSGSENVYPREVENVLYAHPDIAELQSSAFPMNVGARAFLRSSFRNPARGSPAKTSRRFAAIVSRATKNRAGSNSSANYRKIRSVRSTRRSCAKILVSETRNIG